MKLNAQKPRNFINPLLSRKSVDAKKFNAFTLALENYKKSLANQISNRQIEPNIVTNTLKPFLDSFGYQSEPYSQKGQIGIDLAVMQNSKPSVIIEAKLPNSAEMIVAHDLNKRAFHQAIMYFMNERAIGNKALFHIIVTDFHNWFVFDAKDFDRHFWQNKTVKKVYDTFNNPNLLGGDKTKEFYDAIAKELPKLKRDLLEPEEIDCAHFNVQLPVNEKELTAIYKLLSADCLLKEFNPNDANSLNREFYAELLYILGLEESKDGGKKVIGKAKNPQIGTFYENISDKLNDYNKPNDFEAVIKLIIIWVNRILFLKLLESQTVKWSGAGKFLNAQTLRQYDQLDTLFFKVLAKPVEDRTVSDFKDVPYLNSSLFDIHANEIAGITIATLTDDLEINYYTKTVVKDANSQRKTGKVSTLPYLLAFLDAYDFANDSNEELVSQSKDLISASVLGLIFEKINGYKDGSFYTPSFITMYMARETITKTVIDKFNTVKGWGCITLKDVLNEIKSDKTNPNRLLEANQLINDIKICDPAVGSGHFLVSALNELLKIKSELNVLMDADGVLIDHQLLIENDELILKDDNGYIFEYDKNSIEKTRIQKTLFKEKQLLIENCLFGVDINPNSVNICRLRLWIELLKNAYYKANEQGEAQLDTLPNIDINIKCGNSLISRFGLTDDLDSKTIKAEIQDYKQKVTQYKQNIGSKRDVLQAIDAMKAKFQATLKSGHAVTQAFNKELSEYVREYDYESLSKDLAFIAFNLNLPRATHDMFDKPVDEKAKTKKREKVEDALTKAKEIESGVIYQNAFEWRFEFPEVLNEQGEFVGFDVVIGNPPYIDSEAMTNNMEAERNYIARKYDLTTGNWDIYIAFFERSLSVANSRGAMALITPDKWLTKPFGQKLRSEHGSKITRIVKAGREIFDSANVDSLITFFEKSHTGGLQAFVIESDEFIPKSSLTVPQDTNFSFDVMFSEHNSIIDKLSINSKKLSDFAVCENACSTADTYKLKEFLIDNTSEFDGTKYLKVINTGTISKYISRYGAAKMTYLKDKYLSPVVEKDKFLKAFANSYGKKSIKPKIIGKGLTLLDWFLDGKGEFIPGKSTLVILHNNVELLKALLIILNSKLIIFFIKNKYSSASYNGGISFTKDMINNLPVPLIDENKLNVFTEKVTAIITAKQNHTDTSKLEAEVDAMVYALYGLTDDEIKLIEGVT